MKKSVLLLASALFFLSCNAPDGGNLSRLKKTDDVVSYADPHAPKGTYKAEADTTKATAPLTADATATEVTKVDSAQVK